MFSSQSSNSSHDSSSCCVISPDSNLDAQDGKAVECQVPRGRSPLPVPPPPPPPLPVTTVSSVSSHPVQSYKMTPPGPPPSISLLAIACAIYAPLLTSGSVGQLCSSTSNNSEHKGQVSPLSPNVNEGDELFNPPAGKILKKYKKQSPSSHRITTGTNGSISKRKNEGRKHMQTLEEKRFKRSDRVRDGFGKKTQNGIPTKSSQDQNEINDGIPCSAADLQRKEKLKEKIIQQVKVAEIVKCVLKPHFKSKNINKTEYKDILKRAVQKVCHNEAREVKADKVKKLVDAYVEKLLSCK